MVDIFISYAREDQEVVKRLAVALELQGWSVFWDRTIPAGEAWRSHIGKALEEARCVVVAWSIDSIESHWVQEEADDARMRNVLIPVLLAPISPPIGFRSITAANLSGWNGNAEDEFFLQFRADISRKLGDPPALTEAQERQRAEEKQKAAVPPERHRATEIRKTTEQIEKKHSTATSQAEKPAAKEQPETLRIARKRRPLLFAAIALSIITVVAWTARVRLPQNRYELTVLTSPPNASIEIQNVGQYTPGMPLEAGTYTVRATSPGYQTEEKVFEVAERDVKLNLKLQPTLPLPELVEIPVGSFMMGSEDGRSNEKPIRAVHIAQPFYLGKTEVTFDEYDAFAEATDRNLPHDEGWGRGDRPVIGVSWEDASAYAQWLSEESGSECRLPSEAEWEYAARAGTKAPYALPAPEGGGDLSGYANCDGCGSSEQVADEYQEQIGRQTLPVASFPANAWGLHDMHGNVWEWVADCWHGSYEGAPDDGSAWSEESGGYCSLRVQRGGSWADCQDAARSAVRFWDDPHFLSLIGFRVLCSSPI